MKNKDIISKSMLSVAALLSVIPVSVFFLFSKSIFVIKNSKNIRNFNQNQLLIRGIKLESLDIIKFREIKKKGKIFDEDEVLIRSTTFLHCIEKDGSSAIKTSVPLYLFNCLFECCKGNIGGCIFSTSKFSAEYTTFLKCSANKECGVIRVSHEKAVTLFSSKNDEETSNIKIITTSFCDVSSNLFGSIFISNHRDSTFSFCGCNVTKSVAMACVGIMEVQKCAALFSYSIFNKSGAGVHNGGFVFRENKQILMKMCNLNSFHHKSFESTAAAAILIYTNPEGATIEDSSFTNIEKDKSYIITVASGLPLTFKNCFFTEREDDINKGPGVNLIDTRFLTLSDNELINSCIMMNPIPAYISNIKTNVRLKEVPRYVKEREMTGIIHGRTSSLVLFAISLICTLIFSYLLCMGIFGLLSLFSTSKTQ